MAILKKTIPVLIAFAAWLFCTAASAQNAAREIRIGLIGADPGQVMQAFDPFAEYLKISLRGAGVRGVTIFVAKNLDQMKTRIRNGKLDFILTTAYPMIEMEDSELAPALVGVQETAREDFAVFFVRKRSPVQDLSGLRGKILAFGTPWSTAGYALAVAELRKNGLSPREITDRDAPADAVRYRFAGQAINQAFQVIRLRADAGVMSSSNWNALSRREQSRLRVIHRTAPVTRLLGGFRPSFPAALKQAVEQVLVDMAESRKGRTALAAALHITKFERLTEEDRNSLQRLRQQLWTSENHEDQHQ